MGKIMPTLLTLIVVMFSSTLSLELPKFLNQVLQENDESKKDQKFILLDLVMSKTYYGRFHTELQMMDNTYFF